MLAELVGILTGMLSDECINVLKQPIEKMLDERRLRLELTAAVKRAEERFAREYQIVDAELTDVLVKQTRFADIPSVQIALREMLTHPFYNPKPSVEVLKLSFNDVLPMRLDRERVDTAVTAFLHCLGEEVLSVTQLQPIYSLAFQKVSAESNRVTANNTTIMVGNTAVIAESLQNLHKDLQQAITRPVLPSPEQAEEPLSVRHNLPQRTYTQFVGRGDELQKLTQLMRPSSRHFLVTLDGIGGVGKSALALELAYRYRENYDTLPQQERFDAIVWVSAKRTLLDASGIKKRQQAFSTLADLYREIATVMGQLSLVQVDMEHRRRLMEHILTTKRVLLIVDNLETVDEEEDVSTFLRELPEPTKAIVTTRRRIDVAYQIRLSGMPHRDALELIKLEVIQRNVELPLDAAEDLYKRTGGIPLAMVWSIALMSMGGTVKSVLRRLGSGQSDIAHFCFTESVERIKRRDSYRLLLTLSLFDASVSRKWLGDIAGLGDDEIGRDEGLAELLQLSLVNQEGDRFALLPLTRIFAHSELELQPSLEQELRERWIQYLIEFAKPYGDLYWLQYQRYQNPNEGIHLVTLVSWCQSVARLDILLKIFPALAFYYDLKGQWADILSVGQIALEHARLTGNLRSAVYIETHALCEILSQQGRFEEAENYISDSLKVAEQLNDISLQVDVLVSYSTHSRRRNMLDKAEEYCNRALQLAAESGDPHRIYWVAYIDYELGKLARDRGQLSLAQQHLTAARDVFRYDESEPWFNMELAWGIYSNLGVIEQQLDNLDTAEQIYLQCLAFFKDQGSRGNMITCLTRLAILKEQLGDPVAALEYTKEALLWSRRLDMALERRQSEELYHRLTNGDSQTA